MHIERYRNLFGTLLLFVGMIVLPTAATAKATLRASTANCGPLALAHLMTVNGDVRSARQVQRQTPQTDRGFSIAQLQRIAADRNFPLTAVRFSQQRIEPALLPLIVHLPRSAGQPHDGHFIILEKLNSARAILYDPQSATRRQLSRHDFSSRWQSIALISGEIPFHAIPLEDAEAVFTYGGTDLTASTPTGTGDYGDASINAGPDGGNVNTSRCGTPVWSVNMVNMNIAIHDVPLWYDPPIGPQVQIALTYNSKYPANAAGTIARKWTLNYHSFLTENADNGNIQVTLPDGRKERFTPDTNGGYTRGYKVFNKLEKIGTNHFRLTMPDDTVFTYRIPVGSGASYPVLVEWRDRWGQALTFGYNAGAQLETITDPVNQQTVITWVDGRIDRVDDPFGRYATFDYDENGDLRKITDMGGYWTALAYDANGYIAEMENEKGKTLFYVEPSDSGSTNSNYPAPGATMQANYRITVTNAEGGKSEYYYNGRSGYGWYVSPRHYVDYVSDTNNNFANNVPKIIYNYANTTKGNREEISTITWQEGTKIGYTHNSDTGMVEGISDYSGNTTSMTYNNMGRITTITPPVGLGTTYQYNPANQVDLEHVVRQGLGTRNISNNDHHQVTRVEDEQGHIHGPVEYDEYGRIDTITETFEGRSVITDYIYYNPGESGQYRLKEIDKDGKTVASYTYDTIGRVRTATDATGLTLTYDYNDLNHVTKITYPDTKFIEYSHASCCPRLVDYIIDRAGRTTYYNYDQMQRLESVHQPGVGYINYRYDANGNLERIIDANDRVTRFEYNDEDRLYRKYDADERYVEYLYNKNGLLWKRINARGVETTYGYYEDHQLAGVTHSDGTPGQAYTYDDYRRLDTVTDALGLHDYDFYDNALVKTIDGPWADDTIGYIYDNLNRVKSVTPQGGRPRTHVYDNQGRLENIILDTATYIYGYQDANPLVRSLTRPNGSITSYDYNRLNQLKNMTHKNSSETVLSQFDFEYNDQDLIKYETITNAPDISGFTENLTTYDHNALNQLTTSTDPNRTYDYDDDGNMTGGFTPTGIAFTAEYDANDRMKAVWYTDNGTVHRHEFVYGYDGFLGRVITYENAVPVEDIRMVRDGSLTIQDRNADNTVTREYAWGLNMGGGIGGLINLRQGGQDYNYLYDGKGNVSAVIDSAQAVVASYRYDSFGRLMQKSGTLNQPYQFSTKRYFADVGLNYYGYRFYNSSIGRWMNRDPLGEAGGLNLYGFVSNDPVNYIDPTGEFAVTGTILLVWGGIELGLSIYDAWDTGRTLLDPCASNFDKGAAIGGLVMGMVMPGGGYGTGLKFTKKLLSSSELIAKGRKIRKVETLVEKFGGKAKNWKKMKGWDEHGVEFHWYENKGNRVGLKPAGAPDPF